MADPSSPWIQRIDTIIHRIDRAIIPILWSIFVRLSIKVLDIVGSADILALSNGDLLPIPPDSRGYSPVDQ